MKTISQYEAKDGTRFDDEDKCLAYELLCIELIEVLWGFKDKELNGDEFIQHPQGSVREARNVAVDVISKALNISDDVANGAKSASHNQTIFGRYVDDSGNRACKKAWSRFMSMNVNNDREYSQPYYALNS